jgi:RND family efflux transporter MFP subunit
MADEDLSKLRLDKSGMNFRRKRKLPKAAVMAVVIVVVASLLLMLFGNPAAEVEVATVSSVYPSQAFTLLSASGYVVAQRKAAVASKATGRLEWLGVEEGSRVKAGQVIARLENRDVLAARDQAEANLDTARAATEQAKADLDNDQINFSRSKDLLAKGFIAKADYDNAETQFKRAQAVYEGSKSALNAAQAALTAADVAVEYTLIRAPFDAVVLTKDADVGDIVTPLGAAANAKAAVVTIADMTSLQVEVDVSESNIEKVKAGQPCEIQLDALPDTRFRGVVHMIVPTADRTKASVLVKVRFLDKDSRVLPEMSARVGFLERPVTKEEQQPKTGINPKAVIARNGGQFVFVVRGDRAVETPVKTGEAIGDLLEVIEGVKPGDKVVADPPKKLRNGSKIARKEP